VNKLDKIIPKILKYDMIWIETDRERNLETKKVVQQGAL
jgi:hypothetical protein